MNALIICVGIPILKEQVNIRGKRNMKCKGRLIHPEFRENFCGQKRVKKSFPCLACDLLELTENEKKALEAEKQ